jgi:hypothetical protein
MGRAPPPGGVPDSVVKELGMVQVNLSKGLDKAYEDKSLAEILAAPPSALAGLTTAHDAVLKDSFGIDTVRELGTNKYFALAGVLVALANKEG